MTTKDTKSEATVRAQHKASIPQQKPEITFDALGAIDLRAGTILAAKPVAKSKKLLRLDVDLGEDTPRQIISGLAETYAPEALVGIQVIVVANLKPATIMGQLSSGMVLAAGEAPKLALCRLDAAMAPGTKIR